MDPSQFRAFTPQETAQSDPVRAAVARGELVPAHGLAAAGDLPLGGTVAVQGRGAAVQERVGALAAFGVPGVDAVVDRASAAAYGAKRNGAVLLAAPERTVDGLTASVREVVGTAAEVVALRPVQARSGRCSSCRRRGSRTAWTATADINDPYDAVPAAARYLCQYGGGRTGQDLYDAEYAYNHLDSHVRTVLDLASRYQ